MNTNEITATTNGGGVNLSESVIPSTYSSSSFSVLIDRDYELIPTTRIPPIDSMYYYAKRHIPNYQTITTYPNDIQYNPDTNGVTDFRYAFANMKYCRDTIGSIMNRFDWNSCTTMYNAFYNCYNLTGSIPNIPNSVTNMSYTFANCYNITGYISKLPNSIRDINGTFYNCSNLTGSIPSINDDVSDMSDAFHDCSNLTGSIPNIPKNVLFMNDTFSNCYNLTGYIPNIPGGVTGIINAFYNCYRLSSSNVYIHSRKILYATNCFYNMGNTMNIYVHAGTATYNSFYKAMGNSTYNPKWNCYLKTF